MPVADSVIEHLIPKSAEGSYYSIGFTVPDGLERVTVNYSYSRLAGRAGGLARMVNVVDLGLADAHGTFLGWSGSARSTVFVGPYAATPGYHMAALVPGEWQILVGAYKIPDGGLPVRYEITYTPKAPRWLVGDLHMHSTASDGQHSVHTLARKALRANLDFIAVSDHNNYSENLHPPVVPGLTLLPAVEWTHYRGHMNFFGVPAPFDNSFVANSEQEMLALVAHAKAKGALVSVNHPKCTLCPYLWQSEDCFDLVEVWNGPMRKANLNAVAWWHGLLLRGKKLPLVGGSDYHRDRRVVRFAHPVTWVHAPSPAPGDILRALACGHSYVAAKAGGVRLQLRCGTAMMGDTVTATDDAALELSACGLGPGMRVRLVTSQGTAAEWRRFEGGQLAATVPCGPGWQFAYLTVSRRVFGTDYLCAISNPIYFAKEP